MPAVGIVQARMGSSRLPGKVLRGLGGHTVLGWVVRAARAARYVDDLVVATTRNSVDDAIVDWCEKEDVKVYRGDDNDVLGRFLGAWQLAPHHEVVRLTSDCPLVDPAIIDAAVAARRGADVDYMSTTNPRSLPRGLDVEVTTIEALRRAAQSNDAIDHVHVTPALYRDYARFTSAGLVFHPDASDLRVTVDTAEDANLLEEIVALEGDAAIPWRELVRLLRSRPDLVAINSGVRQKDLQEG